MKTMKQVLMCVLVIMFFLVISGSTVFAQEKKAETTGAEKNQELLELQYSTPGENHKFLDYFIGEWESLAKYYEPGAEPLVFKEHITVQWILGGRYTYAVLKGNLAGKDYDVYVYTGYNNYKKEFFAIQLSTMGTGYYLSTGQLDKTGKIRTDTAVVEDPTAGKINVKAVTTILDRDKYIYDFYILDDKGGETKIMDVVYTRKK